jgi:cytochrome c-type biogenesis protein CcmE
MKKKTRMAIVVVVLVLTIGITAIGMLNIFVDPYLSVDDVVENPENYMGSTIQVKGEFVNGSLTVTVHNATLILAGDNHTITVLILGEVPDLIDGQEIVAIGTLESASLIIASDILTSCPSKYEPADP